MAWLSGWKVINNFLGARAPLGLVHVRESESESETQKVSKLLLFQECFKGSSANVTDD